jgi:hypothetical protein
MALGEPASLRGSTTIGENRQIPTGASGRRAASTQTRSSLTIRIARKIHATMKALKHVLLFICTLDVCCCQTVTPAESPAIASTNMSNPLSPYLIYRHFLAWVNQLDQAATASGEGNSYKFAEPFSRAKLQHAHLDILRKEARQLDAELRDKDSTAKAIIAKYREAARIAAARGQSLPPVPAEIRKLERERTAILVQHYVGLRSALGADVTAQLDAYLQYEFAPHVKLKRMSTPGQPVGQ